MSSQGLLSSIPCFLGIPTVVQYFLPGHVEENSAHQSRTVLAYKADRSGACW